MANKLLFKTSCIFGFIHFLAMYLYQDGLPHMLIYCTILALGVSTSIWNHGTTSEMAKWGDRFVIMLGTFSDFFHITLFKYRPNSLIIISVICLAILCYFQAKVYEKRKDLEKEVPNHHFIRDFCHASSHMIATAAHVTVIAILATQEDVDWSRAYQD